MTRAAPTTAGESTWTCTSRRRRDRHGTARPSRGRWRALAGATRSTSRPPPTNPSCRK